MADTIPTIYSKKIDAILKKSLVGEAITNQAWTGDIQAAGDSVRIITPDSVTVGNYTAGSDVSVQALSPTHDTLSVDQQKVIAFNVDDVNNAQSSIELMNAHVEEAAYALRDTLDTAILAEAANATTTLTDAASAPKTFGTDGTGVRAYFAKASKTADEANHPQEGRYAVVSPATLEALRLIQVVREDERSSFERGEVGRFMGFDVFVSNNVPEDSGVSRTDLFGVKGRGIALAKQITKSEMVRLEKQFGWLYKALMVYGITTLQADQIIAGLVDVDPIQ